MKSYWLVESYRRDAAVLMLPDRFHGACRPVARLPPPRPGHAAAPPAPGTALEDPGTSYLEHDQHITLIL